MVNIARKTELSEHFCNIFSEMLNIYLEPKKWKIRSDEIKNFGFCKYFQKVI